MAMPLVASPPSQRQLKLSTSQVPLNNPVQQPTPHNELSSFMMPINVGIERQTVNTFPYPTRWGYLQGLWSVPAPHMQHHSSYNSACTAPQSLAPFNPMLMLGNWQNIYSTQPYGGSFGYQSINTPVENFVSTSIAPSDQAGQFMTSFDSFNSYTTVSSDKQLSTFAATLSNNASPTHRVPVPSNPLGTITENLPENQDSHAQKKYHDSPVENIGTTLVTSQGNDMNQVARLPANKRPIAKSRGTSKRKATYSVEDKKSYKVSRPRTKFSMENPGANVSVWKPLGRSRLKSQQERESIKRTRNAKACDYHRERHEKCNPSCIPWVRCSNVPRDRLIFQTKPEKIDLFRPGPSKNHPLSQRDEVLHLQEIAGLQARPSGGRLILTQGLGTYLDIYVSSFIPIPGDKENHIWYRNGERQVLGMLNYCIGSIQMAHAEIGKYIRRALLNYEEDILQNSNEIIREVLSYASQYAKQTNSKLVTLALHLLAVNRMIERDWHIQGPNTLGIQLVEDVDCPWFGKVPITPMMDTQLDQVVIHGYLNPLRNQLLSELQTKMYDENADSLFDIFLVVFILATNTEWLLRHSRGNAKRYNAKHRYNSIERAQKYFEAHNVLMAHFHHLCRGSDVSATGSNPRASCGKGLTKDQLDFMSRIREKIYAQKERLQLMRQEKRYEAELYWSHQMFFDGWEPENTQVIDEVENSEFLVAMKRT